MLIGHKSLIMLRMFIFQVSEVVPRVNLRYQMDVDKMAEMKSLPANVRNISSDAIYCHLKWI